MARALDAMNSLNIISSRVAPSSSPSPSRHNSLSQLGLAVQQQQPPQSDRGDCSDEHAIEDEEDYDSAAAGTAPQEPDNNNNTAPGAPCYDDDGRDTERRRRDDNGPVDMTQEADYGHEKAAGECGGGQAVGEDTPLLSGRGRDVAGARSWWWHRIPRDVASAVLGSVRWLLSTLASPAIYLISCLYDDQGNFATMLPLRKLFRTRSAQNQATGSAVVGVAEKLPGQGCDDRPPAPYGTTLSSSSSPALGHGTVSAVTSDSDSETGPKPHRRRGSSRHSRAPSQHSSEEISPARRSIRIKLHSDDAALQQRKQRRAQSGSGSRHGRGPSPASCRDGSLAVPGATSAEILAQIKSPTSPASVALTRYPRTPAPPRPLVPRRHPSYLHTEPPNRKHQKTLILDLDETLIHSMAKGGSMATGHMVEVRLNAAYLTSGGQSSVGPQHPILYWVNKRPHCDDFLRRVCKWYNLVIFTASVPEYADPVIDWLEQERKFFTGRYYRQHCTFRQGAFIKDLSSVEPDLSRVMILDNSPLSYMFHQDNAIPIQGWISDPTDNDLLHLVPLLEGLQYVSDVRALLALRGGEDGKHMA